MQILFASEHCNGFFEAVSSRRITAGALSCEAPAFCRMHRFYPIINPVGCIAVLLDFCARQTARPDMDGTAGNRYKFAGSHPHFIEKM